MYPDGSIRDWENECDVQELADHERRSSWTCGKCGHRNTDSWFLCTICSTHRRVETEVAGAPEGMACRIVSLA